MAFGDIVVKQERRAAMLRLTTAPSNGETPCFSLGLFQGISRHGPTPYFVVELQDGSVICVEPEAVRFINEEGDQ